MAAAASNGSAVDVLLIGGGLQNTLLALALRHKRPELRVTLIEQNDELGGNHTWCWHQTDVAVAAWRWLRPLVAHRWSDIEVNFPSYRRTLPQPYYAITAQHLRQVVGEAAAGTSALQIMLGQRVASVTAAGARLSDGRFVAAELVVDARGVEKDCWRAGTGYQKFVGLEVELRQPSGVLRPLIMDATVEQVDGLRFVYVLPFSPRRLLIEDTVFSDHAELDEALFAARLHAYAKERNWTIVDIVRRESGILPMPWQVRPLPAENARFGEVLRGGMAGGWFHPATGYSLPSAVRLAECLSEPGPLPARRLACQRLAQSQRGNRRFARQLNWALFRACQPNRRRSVFEGFYRMPLPLIEAFHALRLSPADRLQLLLRCNPGWQTLRGA